MPPPPFYDLAILGGGAAGFFTALACKEAAPEARIAILERSSTFLSKVKVSGGGRCNVTHGCFDPAALLTRYPRGQRLLKGAFHHWQPRNTVEWFARRGVSLKTEADGRMFPSTDDSQTIIDCFLLEANNLGIELHLHASVVQVGRLASGFRLQGKDTAWEAGCLMVATGGCRSPENQDLLRQLGHEPVPPVPSLFTFHIQDPRLQGLQGISKDPVQASLPGEKLSQTGPVLITHEGLSGPAILRLSAWGARALHAQNYAFTLELNWTPGMSPEAVSAHLQEQRLRHGPRRIWGDPVFQVPARLWQRLAEAAAITSECTWSRLTRPQSQALVSQLTCSHFRVHGKSMNKEEFVTCGGVNLQEINPKTLESKKTPGCWFAGEILDIDGVTGGFNFQAAWTTARLAGLAIAEKIRRNR